jgi:uncharacterized membrane protein (DUF485 family)
MVLFLIMLFGFFVFLTGHIMCLIYYIQLRRKYEELLNKNNNITYRLKRTIRDLEE